MNESRMQYLVAQYSTGEISESEHQELAQELKQNADSRRLFRELVDVEASLTTWANEDSEAGNRVIASDTAALTYSGGRNFVMGVVAIAASIVLVLSLFWKFGDSVEETNRLGSVRQTNCVWNSTSFDSSSKDLIQGTYSLESGVAELSFESGTDVTIEGPCELVVDSDSSAQMISGNAVVNVSEISDGFLMKTANARIVDLGTEYGISVQEEGTEIHVFDGMVEWNSLEDGDLETVEIESGDAKWFSNSDIRSRRSVTFGRIQFVRQLESQIRNEAGNDLVAYDGFENLAGRIRRGRSGFGWTGGWTPPGRRRQNAMIVDTPKDQVFEISRAGRRELLLGKGVTTQRKLKNVILNENQSAVFVSLILANKSGDNQEESSFQFSLLPGDLPKRFGARKILPAFGFGMTSGSSPYVKCGGVINDIAFRIPEGVLFCVAKFSRDRDSKVEVKLRVYQSTESIDENEPERWTLGSVEKTLNYEIDLIQLSSGQNGSWRVDELKIGKTWQSVTSQ